MVLPGDIVIWDGVDRRQGSISRRLVYMGIKGVNKEEMLEAEA